MIARNKKAKRFAAYLLSTAAFFALICTPAFGEGYAQALQGVDRYDAVYDVSQGNPKVANIVFWAVKNSYEVPEVKALPKQPNIVIVFHGPAVKLISSDKTPFNGAEWAEVEKFQETLQQLKKDGVKMEVCLYAAKVMGVDKNTIIPEVDHVGNGFVSVIGYQMQNYAVVRVP